MGQNPEELRKEIAETRDLLEDKVTALAGRFQETADEAKKVGTKVAIVAGVVVGVIVLSKIFRRRGA